jgi:hypothetical protein
MIIRRSIVAFIVLISIWYAYDQLRDNIGEDDSVYPNEVIEVYENEGEFMSKAETGDRLAIDQLKLAYAYSGDDEKLSKVLELEKRNSNKTKGD